MLNNLGKYDEKILNRYVTLEKNIQNKCNSFYDSYYSLFEETFKSILSKETNIDILSNSNGYILRNTDVKSYFIDEVKIDLTLYNKISDYLEKVNKHKHKNEKNIDLDIVIKYTTTFYDFILIFFNYKNIKHSLNFSYNYYSNLFDSLNKQNETLVLVNENLKLKLENFKLANLSNINDSFSNQINNEDSLNNILGSSVKNYIFKKEKYSLKTLKILIVIFLLISMILGVSFILFDMLNNYEYNFYIVGFIVVITPPAGFTYAILIQPSVISEKQFIKFKLFNYYIDQNNIPINNQLMSSRFISLISLAPLFIILRFFLGVILNFDINFIIFAPLLLILNVIAYIFLRYFTKRFARAYSILEFKNWNHKYYLDLYTSELTKVE
ncbi:MAG: hypothetical protein ACRC5M_02935 [Anaeroplasmataceae bacterium]